MQRCGTCKKRKSLKTGFYASSIENKWFVCKACIAKNAHKSWLENRKRPMWHTLNKLRANFPKDLTGTITSERVYDVIETFGNRSALSGRVAAEGEMLNIARWDNGRDWGFDNVIPITKSEMWSHTQHSISEYPRGLVEHIDDMLRSSSNRNTNTNTDNSNKSKAEEELQQQQARRLPPLLDTGMLKADMEYALVKHYVDVYECLPPWFLVFGSCAMRLMNGKITPKAAAAAAATASKSKSESKSGQPA